MDIQLITPEIFPINDIICGVTTKNISYANPYGLSFSEGIRFDSQNVSIAKAMLANYLGINVEAMKFQNQVHGKHIQIVDFSTGYNDSDGLITDLPLLVLNAKLADCGGILVFDPVHRAIAAIHSGWKGTALNIATAGIEKLVEQYSSNPVDLLAYITPSAGGENYEVEEDVAKNFPNTTKYIGNSKYLFDIKKEIHQQLIRAGLLSHHIEVSKECTIANENLHSFRREGDNSGRMSAFIMMR